MKTAVTHPLKTMKLSSFAIFSACLLAASTQAFAILVEISETAPVEDIIKFNEYTTGDPSGATAYWRSPESTDEQRMLGQGFSTQGLTGEYVLNAVTFKISDFKTPIIGLQFNLTITKATTAGTKPNVATQVSLQSGTLPDTLKADSYITFVLDDPVILEPDLFYNVIYSFAEMTSKDKTVNSLGFRTIGKGLANTSGGHKWVATDGSYTASTDTGFVFYAHATAVPESGTAFLVGTGMAVWIASRLHSKRHQ